MENIEIEKKLKPFLDHHPNIYIEFDEVGFCAIMNNLHPNLLGNFTGGDMAYIANAAAGLNCIVEDRVAETVSINIECLKRARGNQLLARSKIIKAGFKLIRLRVDVYVRDKKEEELVAIAQITYSPLQDARVKKLFE